MDIIVIIISFLPFWEFEWYYSHTSQERADQQTRTETISTPEK